MRPSCLIPSLPGHLTIPQHVSASQSLIHQVNRSALCREHTLLPRSPAYTADVIVVGSLIGPARAAIVEMPTPRKVRVVGDGAARPVGARAAGEDRTDGRIKTGVIRNRYTFDGHKLRFCGAASGRDDRGGTPLPQGMKSAGYAHAQYSKRTWRPIALPQEQPGAFRESRSSSAASRTDQEAR